MGKIIEFKEDDVIIKEGAISTHMYMIIEGAVALYINYGTPDEYLLGISGKNKCIGEMGALVKDTSIYTAVAFNDVKCMLFSETELGTFLKDCPTQAITLLKSLASNSRVFRENCKMILDERNVAIQEHDIYKNMLKHNRSHSIDEAISRYALFGNSPDTGKA